MYHIYSSKYVAASKPQQQAGGSWKQGLTASKWYQKFNAIKNWLHLEKIAASKRQQQAGESKKQVVTARTQYQKLRDVNKQAVLANKL